MCFWGKAVAEKTTLLSIIAGLTRQDQGEGGDGKKECQPLASGKETNRLCLSGLRPVSTFDRI